MSEHALKAWVWQQALRTVMWEHQWTRITTDDSGEGVISAAIAVLIMAFLGVVMWTIFNATVRKAGNNVDNQVGRIGG